MTQPDAVERPVSWGPIIRGLRWDGEAYSAFLLHEPGTDIDAWASLPVEIAQNLGIETTAFDLPGHGLSDDPWESERLPDLLRDVVQLSPAPRDRFVISAGLTANVALELAAALDLSGLVCLSPIEPPDDRNPPRSPTVPKLMLAGSKAGNDLATARQLASVCGGWVIVTSVPVTEHGTQLLKSRWSSRLTEEIVGFLRDCQRPRTRPAAQATRARLHPSDGSQLR